MKCTLVLLVIKSLLKLDIVVFEIICTARDSRSILVVSAARIILVILLLLEGSISRDLVFHVVIGTRCQV